MTLRNNILSGTTQVFSRCASTLTLDIIYVQFLTVFRNVEIVGIDHAYLEHNECMAIDLSNASDFFS